MFLLRAPLVGSCRRAPFAGTPPRAVRLASSGSASSDAPDLAFELGLLSEYAGATGKPVRQREWTLQNIVPELRTAADTLSASSDARELRLACDLSEQAGVRALQLSGAASQQALGAFELQLKALARLADVPPARRARALTWKGRALCLGRLFEEAHKEFSLAVKADDHYLPAYEWRGRVSQLLEKPVAAIADFSKYLENFQNFYSLSNEISGASSEEKTAGVLLRRGQCYSVIQDHDLATSDLSSAIALSPSPSIVSAAHASLAEVLFNTSRYWLAIEHATAALHSNPENIVAFRIRALAYDCVERKDLAEADRTRYFFLRRQLVFTGPKEM